MKYAILLFCLLDIGFLTCFLFSIIYDFGAHVVLVVIGFVACITYYPLIILYKELNNNDHYVVTHMWLVNHMQFCTVYCFTRLMIVLIYFSTIIIDGGGVDLSYIFHHVSVDVKVVLGFLSGFFLVQILINYIWIVPWFRHKIKDNEKPTTIYVTVRHDSLETERYTTTEDLSTIVNSAQRVMLVPSTRKGASDLTKSVLPE